MATANLNCSVGKLKQLRACSKTWPGMARPDTEPKTRPTQGCGYNYGWG